MPEIENGVGNSTKALVDENHRLHTFAVVETEFLSVNIGTGEAYVWDFPAYDYDAGDTVMWLRNNSNLDLHIHHIYLYSDTATVVSVHTPIDVTPAGTLVTGMNINLNANNSAEALAYQDETTGVIGPILQTEYLAANSPISILKEEGFELILGKNDVIAVDLTTAGTSTFGHIVGFFK